MVHSKESEEFMRHCREEHPDFYNRYVGVVARHPYAAMHFLDAIDALRVDLSPRGLEVADAIVLMELVWRLSYAATNQQCPGRLVVHSGEDRNE